MSVRQELSQPASAASAASARSVAAARRRPVTPFDSALRLRRSAPTLRANGPARPRSGRTESLDTAHLRGSGAAQELLDGRGVGDGGEHADAVAVEHLAAGDRGE